MSAFWSSSVDLNCAPPNMLDVWPDLQAKGVRQIRNRTLFKFPFSLFTNAVRRHLDECSPFCSVGCPCQMLRSHHARWPLRQEVIVLRSPVWPLFLFLTLSKVVWHFQADVATCVLEDHKQKPGASWQQLYETERSLRLGFFFLLFVSSDSIIVANAALEYKLESLVTDTLWATQLTSDWQVLNVNNFGVLLGGRGWEFVGGNFDQK